MKHLAVLALFALVTATGCGLLHTHTTEPQEIKVVIEQEPIVIQQVPAPDESAGTEDEETAAEDEPDISTGNTGEIRGLGSIKVKKSRLDKLRDLKEKK